MDEPIYVKRNRKGFGVYASRAIGKGEKICAMRGETIRSSDMEKVTSNHRNILIDPLQISDKKFINMIKPYVLVNHSCSPNAGIVGKNNLVAIRDIRKGEEILYDYSSVWFEGFRCRCGNAQCRIFISDFFSIPKAAQKKYMRLGIVPHFIRQKALIKMRKSS